LEEGCVVLGGSLAGGVTFAAGAAGAGGWELFSMAGSSKFTLHGKAAQYTSTENTTCTIKV